MKPVTSDQSQDPQANPPAAPELAEEGTHAPPVTYVTDELQRPTNDGPLTSAPIVLAGDATTPQPDVFEPQGLVGDNLTLEPGDPGTVLDVPGGPRPPGFFTGSLGAIDALLGELQNAGAGWIHELTPEEQQLLTDIADDVMRLSTQGQAAPAASEWEQVYAQMALIKSVEASQLRRDVMHAAGKLLLSPSMVRLADQIRAAVPAAVSLAAILL